MTSHPEEPPITKSKGFSIFRAEDAQSLAESGAITVAPMTEEARNGFARLSEAGMNDGQVVQHLFEAPGFNLARAWFKSGFPLPRHTHDVDCLYYIVAGNLRLGTQTLGSGDGFFVPANAPYTYTPGPDGVEVIEFRHAAHFDIRFLANGPAFWERAQNVVVSRRELWKTESPPQAQGVESSLTD